MSDWEKSIESARKSSINWWVLTFRGTLVFLLGLLFVFEPLRESIKIKTFLALILFFSGGFQVHLSWATRKEFKGWLWPLALGIMELLLSMYLVFYAEISNSLLPYYIGFWLLFRSLFMIFFAFEVKSLGGENVGYLAAGILLCLCSLFIIFNPFIESFAINLSTMIALSISGLSQIYFSLIIRKFVVKMEQLNDEKD